MYEKLEELFVQIEDVIAEAETTEELKDTKIEYINQHRLVLGYFNAVQEEIEKEG